MKAQCGFPEGYQSNSYARKARNPRYCLRAFAASLGAEHSTVSQVLRGARPMPSARIREWALKLGMLPEDAAVYVAAAHASTIESSRRAHQLLHWTTEALAVINEPIHFELLRITRTRGFQPDVRHGSIGSAARPAPASIRSTSPSRACSGSRLLKWSPVPGKTRRKARKLALDRVRQAAQGTQFEQAPTREESRSSSPNLSKPSARDLAFLYRPVRLESKPRDRHRIHGEHPGRHLARAPAIAGLRPALHCRGRRQSLRRQSRTTRSQGPHPCSVLPDGGSLSILQDSQGMPFGLWQRPPAQS